MLPILYGLGVFLVGCLVLAIVLYVVKLILDMLTLPPPIKQIALIIVGLLGLIFLIYLVVGALGTGGFIVIGTR